VSCDTCCLLQLRPTYIARRSRRLVFYQLLDKIIIIVNIDCLKFADYLLISATIAVKFADAKNIGRYERILLLSVSVTFLTLFLQVSYTLLRIFNRKSTINLLNNIRFKKIALLYRMWTKVRNIIS